MPNPVPLATKEDEERRAWVTSHHEVVKIIKECFGDRFSNNEIFDRLKISRRTGYRALGNDERIGKAPGRKPKISEATIRDMVDCIESGGCTDVGNVWNYLAHRFAPDCNPKTVQDAVKRSGFKNSRNTVTLEPLLNQDANESHSAQEDEIHPPPPVQPHHIQPANHFHHYSLQSNMHPGAIDPHYQHQHPTLRDILKQAIDTSFDAHIRFILYQICCNSPEAENIAMNYLCPQLSSHPMHMPSPGMHFQHTDDTPLSGRRPRMAVCRRCSVQYDRAENTMDNRHCLYHKGSPVKTNPGSKGTIEEDPQAYTWSCCGGNGIVRGCCRAMHTTKKKRKYAKKRNADEAGFDGNDDDGEESENGVINANLPVFISNAQQQQRLNETQLEATTLDSPDRLKHRHEQYFDQQPQQLSQALHNHHSRSQDPLQQPILPSQPSIDTRLQNISQELQPDNDLSPSQMLLLGQQLQEYNQSANMPMGYPQLPLKRNSDSPMSAQPGMKQIAQHLAQTQSGAPLPPEFQAFAPARELGPHG